MPPIPTIEIPDELLPQYVRYVGHTFHRKPTYYDRTGDLIKPDLLYLFELPPAIHLMNFSREHIVKVAMPWQYGLVRISNDGWATPSYGGELYLFWSKHQIQSFDDPLIYAKVPDIEPTYDGWICQGSTKKRFDTPGKVVAHIIERLYCGDINTSWHAGGWNIPTVYKNSPTAWAAASEEDPFCYLQWTDFDTKGARPSLRTWFPKIGPKKPEPVAEPLVAAAVVAAAGRGCG